MTLSDDQPVYKYELYRGWQEIADVLQCSLLTAKKMHNKNDLPVRNINGIPCLSSRDLDAWYKDLPRLHKLKLS